MIADRYPGLNKGEQDTVRMVMTLDEALRLREMLRRLGAFRPEPNSPDWSDNLLNSLHSALGCAERPR